jgi:hypothetical protein
MRGLLLAAMAVAGTAACQDNPNYDVTVRLPAMDGGVAVDQGLNTGTASLRYFSCSVSVRFGQCINGRPIQAVIVPADTDQSGSATCPRGSAKKILNDHLGQAVVLGKSAGADAGSLGLVWIQVFEGDDDDDSNVVTQDEMTAYAELTAGTITVERLDDHLTATVDGRDALGLARLSGTIGALDSENTTALGVGPRCTWPIGAKPE